MRKGFTLIELSIVLVIIGLIIGGIVAAKSLIDASKVAGQAAQFQQFDASVIAFKNKYKYLPGDAPSTGGDGDGIIDQSNAGNNNQLNCFACDMANFWPSLDSTTFPGRSNCVLNGTKALSSGTLKNVPLSKMGKGSSFIIASGMGAGSYYADTNNPTNYYAILNGSQIQTPVGGGAYYVLAPTTINNSAVTPAELGALDAKIDDGIANSGTVISGVVNNVTIETGTIYNTPLAQCSSGANYTYSNTGYTCTPLVRIGAQEGALQ